MEAGIIGLILYLLGALMNYEFLMLQGWIHSHECSKPDCKFHKYTVLRTVFWPYIAIRILFIRTEQFFEHVGVEEK